MINANVSAAKAEEKKLEDNQYVPPPGHISFLKERHSEGGAGGASMVTLGGVRMQESRTWKYASELFSRRLKWTSGSFETGELLRLKSFQVTTANSRTSTGSVTAPLFGATFLDIEPEDSSEFHLIVAFGENVERFCSNNSIFVMKGSIEDERITADVTKWLPEKVIYREFNKPQKWSDGSELVQKGQVPSGRSGTKLDILCRAGEGESSSSYILLCTGGVCNPSPGPIKYLPLDSNIFLLKYPEMVWSKLPIQDLLKRSHHSQYIYDRTAYIVGGYSWSDNRAEKLQPVNEVTRITFTDEFQVLMIDVIQLAAPPDSSISFFLTGFSTLGYGKTIHVFGGIAFPEYDQEKENLHKFFPPEAPRNKVPEATSQLLCLNLSVGTVTAVTGPAAASCHYGSMQMLSTLEPMMIMTCDPHLYIYRPT